MTPQENNKIFKDTITPVMDNIHKKYPNLSQDMLFTCVISELRKKNVPLDNALVNKIMDKMASYIVPDGSWKYIKNKVYDNNIIKTAFDYFNEDAADTPFTQEIKRRAELKYNASGIEKVIASVSTAGTDILATAPIAIYCPQSVVYGFLVQGGYDVVNETILLPESDEERTNKAAEAIGEYNSLVEQSDSSVIPGWMPGKYGITDYSKTSEDTLKKARDWAQSNAKWWHDEYEKLGREHKTSANVNGKTFTRYECLVKYNQYDNFRGTCQRELTERYLAEQEAKEQQRKELIAQRMQELEASDQNEESTENQQNGQGEESNDLWGKLLNGLGFNGLGNLFGRNFGYTLANLPDMLLGVFTGKTKSFSFNADTMVPLACLFGSKFVGNPLLKVSMAGYGGLNLFNKLGQENLANAQQQAKEEQERQAQQQVRYKQYADEELNPRIKNVQVNGNQMLADIDRVPCVITLPESTMAAYNAGALPLNTLANAVLAKNDMLARQSEQASVAYDNQKPNEQTRGIR